ncbi:MAG: M24 family metallopeptidase, partial [Fimbriimonas ginsengisoli]|nr:M24 family metallopeptidase [Fimbriimonas ginsengisoli]
MERLGGVPTFCLVGAGANGAEPHHETDATPIRDGDVVVLDYGCEVDGYQSDITRTVALGDPGEEAHRVYHVVYQAHLAGRRAIQPGVSGRDVDRDARKVIVEAGYGEWFVHRTGHGIGMRGHEEPYVAETNTEPLDVGNCVSVEPGVYLPGRFGVRIENIVTVEEGGERSLNDEPLAELLCLKPA